MKIQHQYIGDWPVREAYKQRLKYHSEMAKKKAHREAGSALVKACRGIYIGFLYSPHLSRLQSTHPLRLCLELRSADLQNILLQSSGHNIWLCSTQKFRGAAHLQLFLVCNKCQIGLVRDVRRRR